MIKIIKVSMVLVMGSSLLLAGANQVKLYEIKSGKIEYEIKGSTDMMGMKINTTAQKRVIFDNYGAYNLTETNEITKQTIGGKTQTTKDHTMIYMKGSMLYTADFDKKRVFRMQNPTMGMAALMGGGENVKQSAEEMMLKMGAKKVGTDKVLDYTCDVWDMMGVKQCLYKGIPLKVESNIMGMKNIEIATKAKFDISLSKDDFKLPDFPIYNMNISQPGENTTALDKSMLDAMDKQAEAEVAQGNNEMAALGASLASAMQSAGVKQGERPTQAQEKQMEEAMMESMWPQMKKEFLAEGKIFLSAKECFSSAGTVKEANICGHKMDEMMGESSNPADDFTKWDAKTKKETLGFIDQGLENMKCIEKAQSMQDMKQCMPEE